MGIPINLLLLAFNTTVPVEKLVLGLHLKPLLQECIFSIQHLLKNIYYQHTIYRLRAVPLFLDFVRTKKNDGW